ncbi:HET-domain-containing protein [Aulographum hederae CBS 113979]|uniref:HET-domain-containing protein n=1 Tax=Aulographum hederae CBS 113979 TaxID=1176131 RepID=A0A6G1H3L7_9PEZI|nr:HET-domain-containing protein [Aulographum hederae CBS 113979]
MRLLDVNSADLRLVEFSDAESVEYSILSHTWGEGEVLFADIQSGNFKDKAGYLKIKYTCNQAREHGIPYAWVDTCCIDKSSSAELSEAINSMYSWYQAARVCYVYLADVPFGDANSGFPKSKWFTRGWTLQELIAPRDANFYSKEWTNFGTKVELVDILSVLTGIDTGILLGQVGMETQSIARRMSWASKRTTTRVEDMAYCLMGLFGVNMPMLYGEGKRSFIRLQEEIMKTSDDMSLFAWRRKDPPLGLESGLLTDSPRDFQHTGDVFPYRNLSLEPYSATNRGISITLGFPDRPYNDIYIAALDCPNPKTYERCVGICLKRLGSRDQQFTRVRLDHLVMDAPHGTPQTVYVRQGGPLPGPSDVYHQHWIALREGPVKWEGQRGFHVHSILYGPAASLPFHATSLLSNWNVTAPYRGWIPKGLKREYSIFKNVNTLAVVICFKHTDGAAISVMLGSGSDAGVTADATLCISGDLQYFVSQFNPKRLSNSRVSIVLGNHTVTVDAQRHVLPGNILVFVVDIKIRPHDDSDAHPIKSKRKFLGLR